MVLSLLTEYEKGLETDSSFIIIYHFYGNPWKYSQSIIKFSIHCHKKKTAIIRPNINDLTREPKEWVRACTIYIIRVIISRILAWTTRIEGVSNMNGPCPYWENVAELTDFFCHTITYLWSSNYIQSSTAEPLPAPQKGPCISELCYVNKRDLQITKFHYSVS